MRPLVLFHGFAHPPSSWDVVATGLATAGATVVRCPLPGHAAEVTVGPDWDATLDALAPRLDPAAIAVGYSLGARVALGLLARDRIAGAILVSVHPGLADPSERAARRAADAAWIARLTDGDLASFLDAWEAQPIFATAAHADPAARAARRAARVALAPRGLAAAMAVLGLGAMPDLSAALVARAARARLVVGADDGKFRQLAERLAAAAPALGPTIIDGSGHDPTLEQPAALAAAIVALARSLAP